MGKEILFKKSMTIDSRKRVVLPEELLENLKIKIGDKICVFCDLDKNHIILKKGSKNDKRKN